MEYSAESIQSALAYLSTLESGLSSTDTAEVSLDDEELQSLLGEIARRKKVLVALGRLGGFVHSGEYPERLDGAPVLYPSMDDTRTLKWLALMFDRVSLVAPYAEYGDFLGSSEFALDRTVSTYRWAPSSREREKELELLQSEGLLAIVRPDPNWRQSGLQPIFQTYCEVERAIGLHEQPVEQLQDPHAQAQMERRVRSTECAAICTYLGGVDVLTGVRGFESVRKYHGALRSVDYERDPGSKEALASFIAPITRVAVIASLPVPSDLSAEQVLRLRETTAFARLKSSYAELTQYLTGSIADRDMHSNSVQRVLEELNAHQKEAQQQLRRAFPDRRGSLTMKYVSATFALGAAAIALPTFGSGVVSSLVANQVLGLAGSLANRLLAKRKEVPTASVLLREE